MRTSIGQSPSRRRRGPPQVASFIVSTALLIAGPSSTPTSSTSTASTGAGATPPPASTAGSPALKPIDSAALQVTVEKTAREFLVPGALVVLRTPQGEFNVTYGTTMLGAATPPRADTHFRIASNTKTMTAAVIVQLAQEGKLSLGDPISKYVPNVPSGDKITIAELLKMRSGLYNYTDSPELSASLDRDPTKVWTPDEVLAIAYKHAPQFPSGTAYQYNNTNYVLLGLIAEKLDGKPLATVLQDRLLGPLDMKDTLLPSTTSNTIPDPYSHGYMYGGSAFALVDKPYPPKIQAAARAGQIRPNDYTGQNPSMPRRPGALSPQPTISPPGSRRWLAAECSTPTISASGSTAYSPRTRASPTASGTGTESPRSDSDRTRCIFTVARFLASTPSLATTPPIK